MALCFFVFSLRTDAAITLRGINLSAAEFGHYSDFDPALNSLPGTHGIDYLYPTTDYIDYFLDQGLNSFRIPFRWERIQQTLSGNLDPTELGRLTSVVDYITNRGASVILDVHNYGRYQSGGEFKILGTTPQLDTHFADLWTRLAAPFGNRTGVVFGLMNEPHDMTTETVVGATNLALQAIRSTGAGNLVLVQGNGYSGAHSWNQNWYGTPNAQAMLDIVDPGGNLAFEVHQYANNEGIESIRYSGRTAHVESATVFPEQLAGFTDWLRTNNLRGYLGEIGTPTSDLGVQAMFNGIQFVENNADVWTGWALWAGGPWWDDPNGDSRYHLSVNPFSDGTIAPQLAVLEPFLTPVPEPDTIALMVLALATIALGYRRSRRTCP